MKKKYLYTAIMLFAILVAGMGLTGWYVSQTQEQTDGQELTVVTSFYPMYIAAENVIGDADGVRLENLSGMRWLQQKYMLYAKLIAVRKQLLKICPALISQHICFFSRLSDICQIVTASGDACF